MAVADRRTANSAVVTWTPDGGSAVQLEGDFTTFSIDTTVDTEDASAGNETSRTFVPTLESAEGAITVFDAQQTYKSDLAPGTQGVMNIQPDGTGVGEEELEFNALLTGYSVEYPFDGLIEIEISYTRQGDYITGIGGVQT